MHISEMSEYKDYFNVITEKKCPCHVCGSEIEKGQGMCIDVLTRNYGDAQFLWCGKCSYELNENNEPISVSLKE
ncbi:hypothetical protein D3C72_1426290 [compost metagenome]